MVKEIDSVLNSNENKNTVYHNLSVSELIEVAVMRKEGMLTNNGAFQAYTGEFTGRSPKDKYIVEEPSVIKDVEWGRVNQPISELQFDRLYNKALAYMTERDLFIYDGSAGADISHQLSVRIVTEYAWHNLFARQLFIDKLENQTDNHHPDFTVISLPGLKADPVMDGTNSETFIIISFEKKTVLIGGTAYAGEIKKSIFSVLNYLLPSKGVLPMHCSANISKTGDDVALFFGLSGTGKTTLSSDPNRQLIGDDEHGWSDSGVFNFEGGCYAKCIGLSKEKEPQIWNAIKYGSVLENVSIDPITRELNYTDTTITENTRAAYTINNIPGSVIPGVAGHPEVIIFLTADAFGVFPPISKLTKEQAIYHFLSGYTSKLAGTERGITKPEATFSTCFGEPFLPQRPEVYAKMLGRKIDEHNVPVYLVNTGWTGGSYGTGERIKLAYTRSMITAAISGELEQSNFKQHPILGLFMPDFVTGVPEGVLDPRKSWSNPDLYDQAAAELANRFIDNFSKFSEVSGAVTAAGPK
ncbi:phosphoenolpyruvate carboxykinase (ATP) [Aquibacillus saliphilus]|uniref:phosphoenolpyruvate carboxykinase (ATP) n=1 Tax=Aquibacillus saliphilus TaxID=1909422 RepID=UPI002106CBE8|nr:phosphoenolpyruvate carboxykinase (ATP) [Aquibacillus saliphilus]